MTPVPFLTGGLRLGPLALAGPRALEAALGAVLAVLAYLLRSNRRPPLPDLTQTARTIQAPMAWNVLSSLRRPNFREVIWALLAGAGVAAFVGGDLALPAGILGVLATFVWLSRQRAKSAAQRRARLSSQVPPFADLFAAALSAGLQPSQAAMTVAEAFGNETVGPQGREAHSPRSARGQPSLRPGDARRDISDVEMLACRFYDAAEALLAGADAEAAWSALAEDEATAPLAAAVIRAVRTGAPAAATVGRAARELREAAADALTIEVRAVGVRATAPLALCFLPAFVLLGVLPTALGLLPRLRT